MTSQSRFVLAPEPANPAHDVEIPVATKRRLGLDGERSWIMVSESNRFIWPGPDLRPLTPGDPSSVAFGELSRALFEQVRKSWLALFEARQPPIVSRTV